MWEGNFMKTKNLMHMWLKVWKRGHLWMKLQADRMETLDMHMTDAM